MLGERLGPETIDRLWIFPPLRRGRREWGLVAASREPSTAEDEEGSRRRLYVAPYAAERTGKALHLDMSLEEQGEAPPDRLPRIMTGVVVRSRDDLGDPREIEIEGRSDRFAELMEEFDPSLFEETAEPLQTTET
jgi:hypothetical protein